MDAWLGGAADQLIGQIASAKIPLSRMISPQLYWVMSGDEFTLDINHSNDPKILVVGNNPDRQNIYGAALGLYNSRSSIRKMQRISAIAPENQHFLRCATRNPKFLLHLQSESSESDL